MKACLPLWLFFRGIHTWATSKSGCSSPSFRLTLRAWTKETIELIYSSNIPDCFAAWSLAERALWLWQLSGICSSVAISLPRLSRLSDNVFYSTRRCQSRRQLSSEPIGLHALVTLSISVCNWLRAIRHLGFIAMPSYEVVVFQFAVMQAGGGSRWLSTQCLHPVCNNQCKTWQNAFVLECNFLYARLSKHEWTGLWSNFIVFLQMWPAAKHKGGLT